MPAPAPSRPGPRSRRCLPPPLTSTPAASEGGRRVAGLPAEPCRPPRLPPVPLLTWQPPLAVQVPQGAVRGVHRRHLHRQEGAQVSGLRGGVGRGRTLA
jgi:hypothetical protein